MSGVPKMILFQSDWQDIKLVGANPGLTASFNLQPQHKGALGHLWRLTLISESSGTTSLLVQPGPKSSSPAAARPAIPGQTPVPGSKPCSLEVEIADELVLPPLGSDTGLIARILLHETPAPPLGRSTR